VLYLNGRTLPITNFPDNTSQVWKLSRGDLDYTFAIIRWDYSHEGEFLHLAQLKALLDKHSVPATLRITYLPYGRQDKNISNTSTFALFVFAKLLNFLKFDEVVLHDPHSEVALEVIKNSRAIYPTDEVEKVILSTNCNMLCYPDKGARTKYKNVYNIFSYPVIYGEKVRDQLTGDITSYELVGDPYNKNVLIIDDICDGGATFKILAKDLLAKGAKSVVLFVTHGIFSKGLKTLKEAGIKQVFTQDGEAYEHENGIMYRRLS
jgi:ribose-phosphate pyrophosphokinase